MKEYYRHVIDGSIIEGGVRIADPLSLLCLKVKAFMNLKEEKKTNPMFICRYQKHRDDVFKLLAMRVGSFNTGRITGLL